MKSNDNSRNDIDKINSTEGNDTAHTNVGKGKGATSKTIICGVASLALVLGVFVLKDQVNLRSVNNESVESKSALEQIGTPDDVERGTETTTVAEVYSSDKYTDVSKMTNDEIANLFFSNTVFVGDSLTVGFSNYAALAEAPEYMKNITFLGAVSYTTYNAMKTAEDGNIHPIYKGQPVAVSDVVEELKPDRIFIDLGINELSGTNAIQRAINNYSHLVYRLKTVSPDSKIYIVSVAPMTHSSETSTFNNEIIKEFNSQLEKFSKPWGATYVDLASILTNEQGALPESYSSDGYVHMTNTVYSYWANFFRTYATEHINDGLD